MNWKQWMKKLSGDRGYYIALAVCAAAVVVSGWLFVRSLRSTDQDVNVPDAVEAAVVPTLNWGRKNNDALEAPDNSARTDRPAAAISPETEAPVEAQAPEAGPSAKPMISLTLPVEGSLVQGYSMDKLAYNSTTRDWRTHAGMDLAAPEGAEVRAAAEGTVLAVYEDDLLGTTVTIRHAWGWETHYANLAEDVAVSAGDLVAAGQPIGTVGHTALGEIGSESHLHFAVYQNNVPRDPAPYLPD